MELEVTVARIEERQIAQGEMLKEFVAAQREHNKNFYSARDELNKMKSKVALVSVMISAGLTLLVNWFKGKG